MEISNVLPRRSSRRSDSGTVFPRDLTFDSTLALLREGYLFVTNRCRRLRTDVFEARVMLRRVWFAKGAEAAAVFYHPGRFTRRRAMPVTALQLLQAEGSALTLDGAEHRERKALLMSLFSPESVRSLADRFETSWRDRAHVWEQATGIVLHDEVTRLLCEAAAGWAGVPEGGVDLGVLARQLDAMIDGSGSVGARLVRGHAERRRAERWARLLVEQVRTGEVPVAAGSPLDVLARSKLPPDIATIELLNLLRPTVAVNRYIVFEALALHEHPRLAGPIRDGDAAWTEAFVHEVRRFYPFFPAIGGRALEPFEWRGHRFAKDDWMLFDVFATNHDPQTFELPWELRPERFLGRAPGQNELVPQGGGAAESGHRCAGEGATVELMKRAARLLTELTYEVPPQDSGIDFARMPTGPKSGFVMRRVRGG